MQNIKEDASTADEAFNKHFPDLIKITEELRGSENQF